MRGWRPSCECQSRIVPRRAQCLSLFPRMAKHRFEDSADRVCQEPFSPNARHRRLVEAAATELRDHASLRLLHFLFFAQTESTFFHQPRTVDVGIFPGRGVLNATGHSMDARIESPIRHDGHPPARRCIARDARGPRRAAPRITSPRTTTPIAAHPLHRARWHRRMHPEALKHLGDGGSRSAAGTCPTRPLDRGG